MRKLMMIWVYLAVAVVCFWVFILGVFMLIALLTMA